MHNRYGCYFPNAWRTWHEYRFHRDPHVVPHRMHSPPVENIMDNRYGRHGTRAWKNWHERRYARSSSCSDNNACDVIVHVELPPVKTERIIFTMIRSEEFDEKDEYIDTDLSIVSLPLNTGEMQRISESLMGRMARNQARKDAKEIKALTEDGDFVRIHWEKVKRETDKFAEKVIETAYPGLKMPDDDECERLEKEYQYVYLQSLKNRLKDASVDYFETEREAELRKIAIMDSENTPHHRVYHKRDLAIIKTILWLGVNIDVAVDHLVDIHTWADKYEGYYSNPRKEVNWPECRASFRTTG